LTKSSHFTLFTHSNCCPGGVSCLQRVVAVCSSLRYLAVVLLLTGGMAQADVSDPSPILEQCRALSLAENDIHNCLDNYLDILDENLADLENYIRDQLSGTDNQTAVQAFESAQSAFGVFRTANCLWYLEFSAPRAEAEQIGKNCLATVSEHRLAELQLLVKTQSEPAGIAGYYVYGAGRNTFQPCGSASKYWVEGENVQVSELQQGYLSAVTADLQVMYAELAGRIDEEAVVNDPGHQGVFVIESLVTLRLPVDSECSRVSERDVAESGPQTTEAANSGDTDANTTAQPESATAADEPVQTLTGYFGDWIARCEQIGASYGCVLSVEMETPGSESLADNARLRLTRRSGERTVVDVDIPNGLVSGLDDIEQIHWQVDRLKFGALLHSRLEDSDRDTTGRIRQALRERWFIRDQLLPVLKDGRKLSVVLLPGQDDALTLNATLNGLTRALSFADDFTAAEDQN